MVRSAIQVDIAAPPDQAHPLIAAPPGAAQGGARRRSSACVAASRGTDRGRRAAAPPVPLAALFAVLWLALAIHPHDRADWALENVLVLAFGGALFFTRRWFVFSRGVVATRSSCICACMPSARTTPIRWCPTTSGGAP